MSTSSLIRPDVAEMPATCAIPRKSGEMVFHSDWERRAFALVVSLAEQRQFEWTEFQQQLIQCIGETERDDPQNPRRGYYESWLASLEALLRRKQILQAMLDPARKTL